jgi:hypothetical protein
MIGVAPTGAFYVLFDNAIEFEKFLPVGDRLFSSPFSRILYE